MQAGKCLNNKRTDLALEVRETFEDDDVEIKGVILEEEKDEKNEKSKRNRFTN